MTKHRRELTRRGLIGGAAAGAAGLALGDGTETAAAARRARKVDVVVVGAGIAGLVAARELAGKASVAVLEARDRVGGRTLNHRLGRREVVEIGGQWVGPTQDRILKLIGELGLKTFKTYNEGQYVDYRNGMRVAYTGRVPPTDPTGLAEAAGAIARLDEMAAEVPPDAPWEAPSAVEWDSQTFDTWMRDNVFTPGGRALLDLATEAVFAAEPRDISLLFVLFYIRAAGSLGNLINTEGGAQESRIVGGSQRISRELARALGRRVVLGAPVRRIDQRGRRVEVSSGAGVWSARRVIVTVPPPLAARIRYRPALPAGRDQLTQRVPLGSVVKCMAVYDTPFWRDEGLAGQATSDTGPVKITFDNTPPDGRPGVLLGFIEGHDARVWTARSKRARKAAVLESFARYFGERARTEAKGYIEKSWAEDPWTRGCYAGFTPPGVLLDFGAEIREPAGRIHWAGTETATVWNGYMDGAAESGQRAAKEVLREL